MSLYNILFGRNPHTDILLAVIGLRAVDVERLRNTSASPDGSTITVYTRTGGGNREDYPNLAMRKRPEWQGSEDDDFDSTYCTDTFAVPARWQKDVANLGDMRKGLRAAFGRHLAKTLLRTPTEADKNQAAHDTERSDLARTDHSMANGHTFVPHSDGAMEAALKAAEANGGELRSCWGILPLALTVKRDFRPYPNSKEPSFRDAFTRVEVGYEWTMDEGYWHHCRERFSAKYPLAMAKIAEAVERHLAARRSA